MTDPKPWQIEQHRDDGAYWSRAIGAPYFATEKEARSWIIRHVRATAQKDYRAVLRPKGATA